MNLKTKQTKIRQNHNAIKLMWFLIIKKGSIKKGHINTPC